MNYHRKNKQNKFILVIFFLLISGLVVVAFQYDLSKISGRIAIPFWQAESGFISRWEVLLAALVEKNEIMEENRRLRTALIEAEANLLSYRVLADELNSLMVETKLAGPDPIVVESVRGRSELQSNYLLLKQGTGDQVAEGDRAMVGDRVEVGEVVQAVGGLVRVLLYSAAGNSTEAILFPAEAPVTVKGLGTGFYFEVSKKEEVQVGDLILSESSPGSVIGEVIEVYTPDAGAFAEVYARVPVDVSRVNYYNIIPDPLAERGATDR